MRKLFEFVGRRSFISLLLLGLAVLFGADVAMAMAEVDETGATGDDKGLKTDLTGTAASGTQVREGDLADPELDTFIAKFRPYMFPLDTDVRREAKQVSVKGYEVEHYASGSSILDCETTAAVTNTEKSSAVVLPVSAENRKMFAEGTTVSVPEVAGYLADGTTKRGSLMLVVTEKTKTTVTVEALNVPDIPSGSKLIVCANACSESQMIVDPENYQPRPKLVYLQKKIVNIVLTDHFKEIVKKIPFFEQDVKDNALYNFRRKSARTFWIGVQTKRKVEVGGNMGEEFVYTSEGVLRQVQSMYGISSEVTYEDLIGICKMQFTTYSVSNEANVYCGKNFMEKLLNIDFTKHKDIEFKANSVLGIDIKAFKTTFGTLNFKYDPTLDDVGYADYAIVLDIKNASRYVKEDGRDQNVDMKKGAGENREATRDIHTQIDCLALKGFNSIMVGRSEDLLNLAGNDKSVVATSVTELPANPSAGQIVFLTAENGGWAANSLLQYNGVTGKWEEYSGVILG
mgnify:FL=1